MSTTPTAKQLEVLGAIRSIKQARGYPPSMRELAEVLDLSVSTVHGYMTRLVAAGFIRRDPARPRTVTLTNEKPDAQPRWVDIARAIALANDLPEPSDEAIDWVLWERTTYPIGGFNSVVRGLVEFYAGEEARGHA